MQLYATAMEVVPVFILALILDASKQSSLTPGEREYFSIKWVRVYHVIIAILCLLAFLISVIGVGSGKNESWMRLVVMLTLSLAAGAFVARVLSTMLTSKNKK